MSSFAAILKLDQKEYEVINCQYSVQCKTDYSGRPTSQIRDSILDIEIVAPENDVTFFTWLSENAKKNGTVEFNKIDQASVFGAIDFEDSFCIDYSQVFEAHAPKAFVIRFKLTTGKLTIKSGSSEKQHDFFRLD